VVAVCLLTGLGFLFSYPLIRRLTSGVIGMGAGDNLAFVWDFWWASTATLAERVSLWTAALFAPLGTSLLLHTLSPLPTLFAALVFPTARPASAYNVSIIAAVVLNGIGSYAAAYFFTRDRLASLFAGVTFGGAPFLIVRLEGHLNVLSAWGLPLAVLAAVWFQRHPTPTRAVGLGVVLASLGYLDYYELVFGLLLVSMYLVLSWWIVHVQARPLTRPRRRLLAGIGGVMAGVLGVASWIHYTGGTEITIADLPVSMRQTLNLRIALGFLLFVAAAVWKWPRVSFSEAPDRRPEVWRLLPLSLCSLAFLGAPLVLAAAQLWVSGDYVRQVYQWKSAPSGIDVASLVLGNPLHPLFGDLTTSAYRRFNISQIESSAWLGLSPLLLLAVAVWHRRSDPEIRRWLWIGGLFLVWSLGPYLMVFGHNSGIMLPQTFVRFLPIVANARMPGRAFVVVQLVVSLIGAMVLASRRKTRSGTAIAVIATLAVAADYWPRPRDILDLKVPAVYYRLGQMPRGTVLEVPLGIRDGSGEQGTLDPWLAYYQTVHGQPEVGGFVARLSNRIRASYENDPVIAPILEMSGGSPLRRRSGCRDSLACSVRYVVINRAATSPELQTFVRDAFSLTLVDESDGRTLYTVERLGTCSCSRAE
jgi:hypothetical protein